MFQAYTLTATPVAAQATESAWPLILLTSGPTRDVVFGGLDGEALIGGSADGPGRVAADSTCRHRLADRRLPGRHRAGPRSPSSPPPYSRPRAAWPGLSGTLRLR